MRERAAGLLVHPTSLPGAHGSGDLGSGARRLLDWAAEAGFSVWQVLPAGAVGPGGSPYSALSDRAGNPWLLSPEMLALEGWLDGSERACADLPSRAWDGFCRRADPAARRSFEQFVEHPDQAGWLEDWTLFAALREERGERAWPSWEAELRRREPQALRAARERLAERIAVQRFAQYAFDRQWTALGNEARARGVSILGDLPFYPAHDSAEVWSRPELFQVDDCGRCLKIAGVPPDDFSATGQLWGNPTYRWERLAEEGYRWWTDRARAALCRADLVRLDHFRGFVAHWEVDASSATAATGRWMPGPGRSLFGACRAVLGRDLPFVAEDLGTIGPEVHELRQELGLPGMRVLQFAFDDNDDDSPHLPRNYPRDAVAYTGTHDNDTFRGWFDRLDPVLRQRVLVTLEAGERDVVRRAIDTLYASQARLVVVPLQDVLELGSEARMNRPGTIGGNWAWRASASELTLDRAARLRRSAEAAGRA